MNFIKEEKNKRITDAICLIVLGILIVAFYGLAVDVFCLVSGIAAIVIGAFYLIAYFATFIIHDPMLLIEGLVLLLCGSWILADPTVYIYLMVFAISIFLIYFGITEITYSVDLKKMGIKNWWADLVVGILFLLCGIAIVTAWFIGRDSVRLVTYLCGASLIIEGILELVLVIGLHRDYKKIKKNVVSEQ